jgi:hypothetical protein
LPQQELLVLYLSFLLAEPVASISMQNKAYQRQIASPGKRTTEKVRISHTFNSDRIDRLGPAMLE